MNELEIMELMNSINYGWIDKLGQKHFEDFEDFLSQYVLQSPRQLIKSKLGVCWDQVELERYYFNKINKNVETFFIVYYDNKIFPTHTFLTFKRGNKYCWFEHSWERFRGIYEYNTKEELLLDVRKKFCEFELSNKFDKNNLKIFKYDKPKYNISVNQFFKHCETGISVNKI